MTDTSPKRLSKPQRREQLLGTAMTIVREQGTEALTLGYLAERAGVSKPVTYEHFGTRSGLLIELYKQIDAEQVAALLKALERTPRELKEVARVMSRACMNCYTSAGPEWHAISAALKGTAEMEAAQQELVDGYVDLYCEALGPFTKLSKEELRLRCVGLIGAGEAISREMLQGRVTQARAASVLGAMLMATLSPA
ncbi:TetR/AcrR family transcriptional regulator [Schlegelella sp. S2-27]|uniref:TetR/AcrR family transcriptional regulator n=1 Tax=Caldimonas mangrovi TaxID=2944811 RepID=A0ABT0YP12_9BURK|nr:TetR/AcrR family transcriptional regulator [Caldimonas mangrovi]MCM5680466.1 TetR/AcrR family transcriptional regulator [Caldimonas mangrovi]